MRANLLEHDYDDQAQWGLSTRTVGAGLGPWKLLAAYLDFAADAGGADYGTEVDASLVFTPPWKQKLALEVARYDADHFATDTEKVFVWTQWGF